jgi:ubiquinone/menaquinone biosynthesis C-methylase UbiE
MTSRDYLYPNADAAALDRLRGLESIEDEGTIEALADLGDLTGARCLEVGAGAGSIAQWLARQVGPSGSVLATDLDARHLQRLAGGNLEVRTHDVLRDPLPEATFDLVHVRHVLIHLSARADEAYARLARALKPGGVLLCEESDFAGAGATNATPAGLRHAYDAGVGSVLALYRQRGMDIRLGASLQDFAGRHQLLVQSHSASYRSVQGGTAEALYQQATLRQASTALIEGGHINAAGLQAALSAHEDPRLVYRTRTTVRVAAKRRSAP